MSLWRYSAVPASGGVLRRGEIAGESAAAARAALRAAGMTAVSIRPLRAAPVLAVPRWAREMAHAHLRRRRGHAKAEVFDALATLLGAGVPLLDAVRTVQEAEDEHGAKRSPRRAMLAQVREALRAGAGPGEAVRAHPGWFDGAEAAMLAAGHHRGELAGVLGSLAAQHHRRGEVASRLAGVLAYPVLVTCVGLGVVVFLSTRTLPRLTGVLSEAQIAVPALTAGVMTIGQCLALWWPALLAAIAAAVVAAAWLSARFDAIGVEWPARLRRAVPPVARRLALARLASELARMVGAGVPFVESLRVLAPTFRGPVLGSLGRRVRDAAGAAERGEPLHAAFADRLWFDAEWRRLVAAGAAAGELAPMLERLADRQSRRARRQIDRLAAALEPAVTLALAAMVGIVVMAAVLPLITLQEIVR